MISSATSRTDSPLSAIAFVFDVDGVIVDSNRVHSAAWREYMRLQGRDTPDGFFEFMFGRHNDEIVRQAFGPDLEPDAVFRHGAEKEKLYRKMMGPVLAGNLVPGIAGFLERHAGRPMAVATNCEPANAQFILERSGLRRFFQVVIDGAQVARPKPDPEIYLRAAQELGTNPADCIVFEDSRAGVQAARAAGARVVLIETTHTGAELAPLDLSVRDFLDPALEPWVGAQKPGAVSSR